VLLKFSKQLQAELELATTIQIEFSDANIVLQFFELCIARSNMI